MTAQRCRLIGWDAPLKKKNIFAKKRKDTVLEIKAWNIKNVDPTSRTQEPTNIEN